jgi:hypothetical protein
MHASGKASTSRHNQHDGTPCLPSVNGIFEAISCPSVPEQGHVAVGYPSYPVTPTRWSPPRGRRAGACRNLMHGLGPGRIRCHCPTPSGLLEARPGPEKGDSCPGAMDLSSQIGKCQRASDKQCPSDSFQTWTHTYAYIHHPPETEHHLLRLQSARRPVPDWCGQTATPALVRETPSTDWCDGRRQLLQQVQGAHVWSVRLNSVPIILCLPALYPQQ